MGKKSPGERWNKEALAEARGWVGNRSRGIGLPTIDQRLADEGQPLDVPEGGIPNPVSQERILRKSTAYYVQKWLYEDGRADTLPAEEYPKIRGTTWGAPLHKYASAGRRPTPLVSHIGLGEPGEKWKGTATTRGHTEGAKQRMSLPRSAQTIGPYMVHYGRATKLTDAPLRAHHVNEVPGTNRPSSYHRKLARKQAFK